MKVFALANYYIWDYNGEAMATFNQILNAIQLIGLFPIVGGTIVLGALVAPITHKILVKKDFSKLMTKMFAQFHDWLKISASVLLAGKLVQLIFVDKFNFFVKSVVDGKQVDLLNFGLILTFLLVIAIAAISYHLAFKTTPQILLAYDSKSEKQSTVFNKLHKESELLNRVNFLLAFLLLLSFAV